ncbi:YhcH/YjgK/YiaL family protein [Longimicrobium sp.]|uniref:YhcH/YjgK/YiaL family protein n=1 Tax=Longimicrobium sp. TaxID=2029185 RepID=UPI002E2F5228|nr:YhcH/YjgK/YiaL family protein [Longimicrobium sp.]HEX6042167.1 YhcH/YjgK/YiaL family protein [Longimicrobium sp.]
MILTTLAESGAYEGLGERVAAGLRWLRTFDPAIPDGRHAIDGDDVFALVSTYDTGPSTEKRFETHVRHVDLQYVASGHERILHAPAAALTVETPYDEATDVAFYAEPPFASSLLMRPGDLAVFHPDDAHKPGCMAGGRHTVRKVVVKVRV